MKKKGFLKILASIATTMAFTIIIKCIIFISPSQKKEFINAFSDGEEKRIIIREFTCYMRPKRFTAVALMLGLIIFFYYYVVGFSAMYVNTQRDWLFAGIWSLLLIWIGFAPLFIYIISFVEACGNKNLVYYFKRLFPFLFVLFEFFLNILLKYSFEIYLEYDDLS